MISFDSNPGKRLEILHCLPDPVQAFLKNVVGSRVGQPDVALAAIAKGRAGDHADLVALDCWPGGSPTGEDAGFNGIIARTAIGAELLTSAIAEGALELDMDELPIEETLESWQPHQSRRKAAVASRLRAMASEGLPEMATPGLRLDQAEQRLSAEAKQAEFEGTVQRIRKGVAGDPRP